jgi:threonine aldolase
MIWVENTHNAHGGIPAEPSYLKELKTVAAEHNLLMHCDGARLWNASIALGAPVRELAESFDSVSVCFSKGLGAPVGSALCSSHKTIEKARKWRKILGGGMRQSGILAAGALFALKNNFSRIADDHANTRRFAEIIMQSDRVEIDLSSVKTNMVVFRVSGTSNPAFLKQCADRGLLMGTIGAGFIRAVFHLDADRAKAEKAGEIILDILR